MSQENTQRRRSQRGRRPRGSVTRDDFVRGAFEICQNESVDALSLPYLARHLEVGVTSMYWYFKSKEELLDALTEEAFKRFYDQMPPVSQHQWEDVLRTFFTNFRNILRRDTALCDLIIMRNGNYTRDTMVLTWSRIEEVLEVLVDAGFSEDDATYAYFCLSVYTRGALVVERISRDRGIDAVTFRHRTDVVSGLPVLSHEVLSHSWSMVDDDDFEFGLENGIRGLRCLLDEGTNKAGAGPTGEQPRERVRAALGALGRLRSAPPRTRSQPSE